MPLSSRKIIEYIASLESPTPEKSIINFFVTKKTKKRENRKGKKKPYNPAKDIDKIITTIQACIDTGLVSSHKKKIFAPTAFIIEETLHKNSTGNGMIRSDDYGDIIVSAKDMGRGRNGDKVQVFVYDLKKDFFLGRVIGIVRSGSGLIVLEAVKSDHEFYYLKSIDFPSDVMYCSKKSEQKIREGFFAFARTTGEYFRQHPLCILEATFSPQDESTDFQRIRTRHDLPRDLEEPQGLPTLEDILNHPTEGRKNRKDFRELFAVTIDGQYAKDFDDAISIEELKNGYRLYVHIADVSAYISPGSQEDREAYDRGTSYYIGNNVIPMFHESISNGICSLRQDEDRPAMTAIIEFNSRMEEVSSSFTRSLIRVNKRLTYTKADEILSDNSSPFHDFMKKAASLSRGLKKERMKHGRLDLQLNDTELVYNGTGIKEIVIAKRLESHFIIEEFMLSANIAAARALRERGIPTLYRVHEKIEATTLVSLKNFLKVFGISAPKEKDPSIFIQSVLREVSGKEYSQVVNYGILRSLMQAFYGIEPQGHFGLGFKDYTHFTSPIRRYPDLVVHRCLKALIDGTEGPYSSQVLHGTGEASSEKERLAMKAERDMVKLKACRLMFDRKGETFNAVISGIGRNGFFVALDSPPIEGMVPLRYLTNDYYVVKEDDFTVVGKRLGKRFRLGDKITVRLADVDIAGLKLDFTVF